MLKMQLRNLGRKFSKENRRPEIQEGKITGKLAGSFQPR